MSIQAIIIQVGISLSVVALYHLWTTRGKRPAQAPRPAPASVAPAPVAAPKPSPATTAVPPEILAIVAAAIAVVLDRPYRVVSVVRHAAALVPEGNAWAMEGRVEQFMSHRVR
jgi:hypothetical protein